MTRISPFRLVAIDDSTDDIFLLERLLQRLRVPTQFLAHPSGEQGIAWLSAQLERKTDELPDAILVDLHMPGMSGLDVLRWVRRRTAFVHTAAIMWSSSPDPTSVQRANALGAQCFLVKHPSSGELADVLRDAYRFVVETESRPLLFQGSSNRMLEAAAGVRASGIARFDQ